MSQSAPVVTRPAPHGRAIGRYLIFGQIGSGGTATVHFGRLRGPAGFSRTVALKRLHTHLAADPHHASLFLAEARLNARIHHPNVVPLLDVVALEGGELLLVMDYVHGETLGGLLGTARRRGGSIPLPVTSAIMTGVLLGLHAAHEATSEAGARLGLVHGDVSPHNVIVGADGTARVLDFGIAKVAGGSDHKRVMGTPSYMAPERWRDGAFDRRSDLFGAGVVLWELLALERLFRSQGVPQSPGRDRPITPPSRVNPAVPAALDAVVMRALQAKPEDRFATGLAFARALEAACPPATNREVSEWVNEISGHRLRERATELARIEAVTTGEGIAPDDLRGATIADESGTAFSLLELDEPPTLKTRGDTPAAGVKTAAAPARKGPVRLRTEDDEPTVVEANLAARLALLQEVHQVGQQRPRASSQSAAITGQGHGARSGLPPSDAALSLEAIIDDLPRAPEPARTVRRTVLAGVKPPTVPGLLPATHAPAESAERRTPVRPAMQYLPTAPPALGEPLPAPRFTPPVTQPVVAPAPEPAGYGSGERMERRRRRSHFALRWPAGPRSRRAPRLVLAAAALFIVALPVGVVVHSAVSGRAPGAPQLAVAATGKRPAPGVSLAREIPPARTPAATLAQGPARDAVVGREEAPASQRQVPPPALEQPGATPPPPAAAEPPPALDPPPVALEPPPIDGQPAAEQSAARRADIDADEAALAEVARKRAHGRRVAAEARLRRSLDRGSRESLASLNRRAVAAYEALDVDVALGLLQRALRAGRNADLSEMGKVARTHLYLGVVLAGGFKQPGLAAKHFRTAQNLSPGLMLPRRLVSPDVDAAYRQAGAVASSVR